MSNESLCQVPISVDDPAVLKRFLDRLVERLDIVLGYRGDNPAISKSQLTSAISDASSSSVSTQTELEAEINDLKEQALGFKEELDNQQSSLDDLKAEVSKLSAYSITALRDFNDILWQAEPIYTVFTALGSDILNPPVALVPTTTYTCYIEVRPAYVQKVLIVSAGFTDSKNRAGLTWAELITHGWV